MVKIRESLEKKAAVAMLIVAMVLSFASVLLSYRTYVTTMEEQYEQIGIGLARTAAAQIDAESIDRYLKTKQTDPAYEETLRILSDIQANNNVAYLYVVKPEIEGAYYVYDTDPTEEACELGCLMKYYPGSFTDHLESFLFGEDVSPIISKEEFGWLMSIFQPLRDSDGNTTAYVCVDLSMEQAKQDQHDFLLRAMIALTLVAFLLAILFLELIRKMVVRPINSLASAASSYISDKEQADGTLSAIEQLDIKTGDEMERLCVAIKKMEQDIHNYIQNLNIVTAEKERIGAELDVAKHIQGSMLPSIFPAFPERPELDIYATMTPAKEVGGDFYDFFLIDDDHLGMVMADVSGKGVPAALFMVIAKTLLKNVAQSGLSPKSVLEKVNKQLCVGNDAEMFVTVWLGILEISTGEIICASAGHEYPVIKRLNEDYELLKDRHGFVLAGLEHSRYTEYTLQMNPGDRLFLYTDGVPEATNAHNELYGTERMLAALNRSEPGDCKQLLVAVKQDVDAFVGEAPQFDDITMLSFTLIAVDMFGMQKLKLSPSLEALGQVIAFVEQRMEEAGLQMKMIAQMNIAVDEVFSNIARYSGATDATVGVKISDDFLTLRFADNGLPYDPTASALPNTSLSADEREIGGLGLLMVKKFMDVVEYEYHDGLNILTLKKQITER